jgi:flagellar assembly protein FliH
MERAAQALAAALAQVEHVDLGTVHTFEQQVLAMAVAIAEELVGREIRSTDDVVEASIRRAMSLAPDRGDLVLRVHPDDLSGVLESTAAMGHRGGSIQVAPDPAVASGGCVAELGQLRIDAQIDSAFARIREALHS